MQPVLVAIYSDDPLFSEGVRGTVSADASLKIVPCATLLPGGGFPDARADVLLLDSRLADAVGVCRLLSGTAGSKIICLSVADDEGAAGALRAGACGIVFRNAPASEVCRAVRTVVQGGMWAPRRVVLAAFLTSGSPIVGAPQIDVDGWQRLSHREREVAHLVSTGLANKEVSDRLAIRAATVKTHLTRVFQKLGLRSRSELAAACHEPLAFERMVPEPAKRQARRLTLR